MKKYKFTIAYSLDNIIQFKHFEKSIKVLINSNVDNSKDFIVRIFINSKYKKIIIQLRKLINSFENFNFEIITNTNDIYRNWASNRNPMIWWVYFPWIINDSKFLLSIDNDTLPNIDLQDVFDHANEKLSNDKKVILQKKIGFSWKNGKTSKLNIKMINAQKNGKEINSNLCGNGGFVITDIEKYKNIFKVNYDISNISEFRKIVNKFIRNINFKLFTLYISDEAFICYFLNENIVNQLEDNLNFGQHQIETFDDTENIKNLNLHFFLKNKNKKKILLYEYFDIKSDIEISDWKSNFRNAMLNFVKENNNSFNEEQIDAFLDFVYRKMELMKNKINY